MHNAHHYNNNEILHACVQMQMYSYETYYNYSTGDECEISMKREQMQADIKDCCVFAIAFIASIVHGEDPCDIIYKQESVH